MQQCAVCVGARHSIYPALVGNPPVGVEAPECYHRQMSGPRVTGVTTHSLIARLAVEADFLLTRILSPEPLLTTPSHFPL